MSRPVPLRLLIVPLLLWGAFVSRAAIPSSADEDWRFYGRDQANTRFSPLTQIDSHNVGELRVAWRFHAGGSDGRIPTAMECTPLVVRGVMYVTSPVLEVIALDAATGQEIWRYNPFPEEAAGRRLGLPLIVAALLLLAGTLSAGFAVRALRRKHHRSRALQFSAVLVLTAVAGPGPLKLLKQAAHLLLPNPRLEQRHSGPNRGLTYWESGADRRIFFAGGHRLVAIDALSGKPVPDFGHRGVVDLLAGLKEPGRSLDGLSYAVTSPAVICRDVLVLGSSVGEGPDLTAPGDVQAFDIRTGRPRWVFHTIPRPGAPGSETWPKGAWQHIGAANSWAGMSVDESRGLVFVPTASPAFDYYGGDRAGQNLFSDSVVALQADDGRLRWHFQAVHHDLWDYDLPCPPVLFDLRRDGKLVPALVQPTKQGFLFVLDRDTGRPLFPVEERAVPGSTIPTEQASSTQPFALMPAPLVRQTITEADLSNLSARSYRFALQQFRTLAGGSLFLPPSRRGTLVIPGFQGGASWGGPSYNPERARLIINTNEIPYRLRIVDSQRPEFPYTVESFNDPFVDEDGYPAIRPPWGKLSALEMTGGSRLWEIPLGEYPELTCRGIPVTGTANIGGSLQTRSGLIFIAATKDRLFRAFDASSGQLLWKAQLPAAGHASPVTYSVRGRQYVVIAAGGGSIAGSSPSGDEYIAFTLPGGNQS